jgi:hypothetical protein
MTVAEVKRELNCNCGCGFKADKITEAEKHTKNTGHAVTILGTIRVNGKK